MTIFLPVSISQFLVLYMNTIYPLRSPKSSVTQSFSDCSCIFISSGVSSTFSCWVCWPSSLVLGFFVCFGVSFCRLSLVSLSPPPFVLFSDPSPRCLQCCLLPSSPPASPVWNQISYGQHRTEAPYGHWRSNHWANVRFVATRLCLPSTPTGE